MSWIDASAFRRRPILVVEDHLYHIGRLLQAVAEAGPDLLAELTVACLDRPGPDTERAVGEWLAAHPGLQVAAALPPEALDGEPSSARLLTLGAETLATAPAFCRAMAGLLRPGGLLLQDVQLETLAFLPAGRWWESIYLAATVRGMFAERPPACRFVSNKRGYEATFGRDLVEAGFDPRDVMEKDDPARTVVPTLSAHLERSFAWRLEVCSGEHGSLRAAAGEREEVEAELDLVLWVGADGGVELGGGALALREDRRRTALRPGGQEAQTWRDLVADRLAAGPGIPVVALGERLAPEGAGRAELTNVAARHAHLLRVRLRDPDALVTAHHAYRLRAGLRVGRATLR